MAQKLLIYSCVAREGVIIAEYTEFTGNFSNIAIQCLQKLPSSSTKFIYKCDAHTFNFLIHNGYTYCVVAVESAGTQLPTGFLERVEADFNRRYNGAAKPVTVSPNSLNSEFGPKLKEHMQYCVDNIEEISKIEKVKAQVSEVQGVMKKNMETAMDHGAKIEPLVIKTNELRLQAEEYKGTANQISKKMWWRNMIIKLILSGILIALIVKSVLVIICHGFHC